MREAIQTLGSALVWLEVALLTIVFAVPALVLGPPLLWCDRRRRLLDLLARLWARAILAVNPFARCEIEGRQHIARGQPYVLAVNHQSLADTIGILLLGLPAKFIAKRSLFRVPVFGWCMRLLGCIPVERGNPRSGVRCLAEARSWLERGATVVVFVEGTRSPDGELRPFKEGAFRLAVETGTSLLPVVIDGAGRLLRKGSWRFAPGARLRLVVGPPLQPPAPQGDVQAHNRAIAALSERVRTWMLEQLVRLRGEQAPPPATPVAALPDAETPLTTDRSSSPAAPPRRTSRR
ncbi:MAG: hypothetical protein KatS3mg102_2770 [Planctomycetota bacterium]|nr:MAG: hypothetical protein KatS3mg102_2770 [Planctomycetota bacterium]